MLCGRDCAPHLIPRSGCILKMTDVSLEKELPWNCGSVAFGG